MLPQSQWNRVGLILIKMRLKKDSEWVVVVVVVLVGSNRGGWLQRDPAAAKQADEGNLVHREMFERPVELQTTSVMKRGRKMKGRWSTGEAGGSYSSCLANGGPCHCVPAMKN